MGWALLTAVAHDHERFLRRVELVMKAAEEKRAELRRTHTCRYWDKPTCWAIRTGIKVKNCGCYWDDMNSEGREGRPGAYIA
jgi:hypothetical protein